MYGSITSWHRNSSSYDNAMERIIAVHKPMQYSKFYSLKLKTFYVFCSILFLGGSMTWAGLSAWNNQRQTSTQHCSIVSSTTKAYSTFHFAFVPIAYVCSFLSLCFIALLQKERNQNSKNNFRQIQLTTYTVMTAIDIILVTIPSFVLCGANYGLFKPNDIIHGLSYSTSGFLSLCHIGVNIGYNREYRKQLKILFGETKCHWQKLNITNATSFWTTNNKVIVL